MSFQFVFRLCLVTCGIASIGFALPSVARAQEESTDIDVSLSGRIEMVYVQSLSSINGRFDSVPGVLPYRLYDTSLSTLSPQAVEVRFTGTRKLLDIDVALAFGQWADAMAGGESSLRNVGHATITYRVAQNQVQVIAGKMYSHVGLEGARASEQFNQSRSWIFTLGTPTWHTGVRAVITPTGSGWSIGAHLYNGWGTISDPNDAKTIGLTLSRSLAHTVVTYNMIAGAEQPVDNQHWRVVHDLNASISHGRWNVGFDAIAASESKAQHSSSESRNASWYGTELMLQHTIGSESNPTRVAMRGEWYEDKTGYTTSGYAGSLRGLTLTVRHQFTGGLGGLIEGRHDVASATLFGSTADPSTSQSTFTLALLAGF